MIIGLVGTSGAGKSTAAKYLKKQNFYYIELSAFLKKEAKKQGIKKITKKLLQDIGNEFRNTYGSAVLAQKAYENIKENRVRKAIIDGIRNLAEIEFLEKIKNFYLLGINTEPRIRYNRIIASRGKKYIGSYANFLNIEKRDSHLGNKEAGLRVKECLKKALVLIDNNSSIEDFYRKIDGFVEALSTLRSGNLNNSLRRSVNLAGAPIKSG